MKYTTITKAISSNRGRKLLKLLAVEFQRAESLGLNYLSSEYHLERLVWAILNSGSIK